MNTMDENQMLVLRDNAKDQLMQIKTVEDGMIHLNKLKAIDVWVKAEKKDAELQNIVAEQKLRTQRIIGMLLIEGKDSGEIASQSSHGKGIQASIIVSDTRKTLPEIGLTANQSSAFQQIASIPDEDFEEFIEEKKAAVNDAVAELTTTGAVKLAKALNGKNKHTDHLRDIRERQAMEKELKDLAAEINRKYDRDQRIFLVKFIKQ